MKFIILMAFFCSSLVAEVSISETGDIKYLGEITAAKNRVVFDIYNQASVKPRRLVISSPGGTVDYGIELGEWVLSNKLDVEIGKLCISSCANYVFLAGKNKILGKNSLLGWHGGLLQRLTLPFNELSYLTDVSSLTRLCNLTSFKQKYKGQLAFIVGQHHTRECLLIKNAGVDYKILLTGQYRKYYKNLREIRFWSYDLDALRVLGVTNIILKDGIWIPPVSIDGKTVFYFGSSEIRALNFSDNKSKGGYFLSLPQKTQKKPG